ncbi:primosomal protein N' [Paenibacillus arenosi]|uniref:Replication restart protein PriA n=1 Tax=Paenibacillus arenosi TaxID=2774142 RepID=A0ABR9AV84_9BACL|nr:primosomal protein N' [Paenibacillus arenosi]MBD8496866.1 primosomal protein N' [Paenibacillus arenosi]
MTNSTDSVHIARVIVDVPSKQTDRPFDYAIPHDMEPWIEIGSRVGVPFGPRTIQGIVIDRVNGTNIPSKKLKPIQQLLDLVPPLPPDLVRLAEWMSHQYVCTFTAALQVMIPAALKGRTEKALRLGTEALRLLETQPVIDDWDENGAGADDSFWQQSDEELELGKWSGEQTLIGWLNRELLHQPMYRRLLAYVKQHEPVTAEKLLQTFPYAAKAIRASLYAGWLVEIERIKDRIGVKKLKCVCLTLSEEEALAFTTTLKAKRQQETMEYLLAMNGEAPLKDLNASAVKALADKGVVRIEEREVLRDPYKEKHFQPTQPLPLTDEQAQVYGQLQEALDHEKAKTFLLHGVTGSGKTEVYLQAIARCLASEREAIVLVPEISLTPQMVERFKGRFGSKVAVLHSRLSQGERYDEWRKIREGSVSVAIGARSAIFAPFRRIGLIIIDEEHETSYKQEETPKYHARDVSIERAVQHGAVVVLGSATPSMETYYAAKMHGYDAHSRGLERPLWDVELLEMPTRVAGRPLPPVTVVDMREQLKIGNRSMFSAPLEEALEDRLAKGEQVVLLLNRRGYSTFIMCRTCGYVAQCPECDISLTYHMKTEHLRCHYCGYTERSPQTCPECESEHIRFFGTGTQRVEEQLARRFPGIRVIRMDVDTTTEKGSHEKMLQQFRERRADVLLGTQMVAKGLDFPYVTLVGVIAADSALHMPDFRAAEKTFQLLTQVAGRAGRHHLPGEVVVQTYAPEHYSIIHASQHDYKAFSSEELRMRRARMVPPFCRLALLTMTHEELPLLVRAAENAVIRIKEIAEDWGLLKPLHGAVQAVDVFGPVASPIPRIKNKYRFQCTIKCRGEVDLPSLVAAALKTLEPMTREQGVLFHVDVDPQMMM